MVRVAQADDVPVLGVGARKYHGHVVCLAAAVDKVHDLHSGPGVNTFNWNVRCVHEVAAGVVDCMLFQAVIPRVRPDEHNLTCFVHGSLACQTNESKEYLHKC